MNDITKDNFTSYESVRKSNVTNMCDIKIVSEISGLSKKKILYIIKNYGELCKKYPGVRKED